MDRNLHLPELEDLPKFDDIPKFDDPLFGKFWQNLTTRNALQEFNSTGTIRFVAASDGVSGAPKLSHLAADLVKKHLFVSAYIKSYSFVATGEPMNSESLEEATNIQKEGYNELVRRAFHLLKDIRP